MLQGKGASSLFHPWVLMKGSAYARPRTKCPGRGWGGLVGQGRCGLISVLLGILKPARETRMSTPQLGNQLRQDVTFSALCSPGVDWSGRSLCMEEGTPGSGGPGADLEARVGSEGGVKRTLPSCCCCRVRCLGRQIAWLRPRKPWLRPGNSGCGGPVFFMPLGFLIWGCCKGQMNIQVLTSI